ncbi:cytochrome c biogenesis CcdA family protein [Prochlorococcus marinus]|uniref:Cytochrome C biogenesis protein n=1 Tax=Prochlorococcus marinus XMU1408 TaxID=2213228 RepID=A0A318R1R0_PROMR|nr:cytochrome c biogenesis CcdA family protein [Prochlorococcus marinus]MBW3042633.1 cytochrome C biogenesis protein [Prochlorococcus marinus str. XMU1408]PYE01329.1 cytochrome C biogenesis protein [Prochlorococcus marinus XMU1408]
MKVVNLFLNISSISLIFSDLTRHGEQLINNGLDHPSPLTLLIVFIGGLLTSLGPCSLSLLPITVAYLAGFKNDQNALQRTISFCSGIVISLVILGVLSSFLGKIYGQLPSLFSIFISLLAIAMGLNLLGIYKFSLPSGPDPEIWKNQVPSSFAPLFAGLAFGFASSPCTTPVLAVLLAWVGKQGNPISGTIFLGSFAIGQIVPLFVAGTFAASIPKLLSLRPIGKWIPPISGVVLLTVGLLSLLSIWI